MPIRVIRESSPPLNHSRSIDSAPEQCGDIAPTHRAPYRGQSARLRNNRLKTTTQIGGSKAGSADHVLETGRIQVSPSFADAGSDELQLQLQRVKRRHLPFSFPVPVSPPPARATAPFNSTSLSPGLAIQLHQLLCDETSIRRITSPPSRPPTSPRRTAELAPASRFASASTEPRKSAPLW